MKKRSLKKFQIKAYIVVKDNEGNVIESYSDEVSEDVALIWPASSKLQVELYGMRVNGILNMHYYGSLAVKEHDMIFMRVTVIKSSVSKISSVLRLWRLNGYDK